MLGDFNGDGRTDVLCHNRSQAAGATARIGVLMAQPIVAEDSGTLVPFTPVTGINYQANSGTWNWCFDEGNAGSDAVPWQDMLLAGDVDGDGLDDLICHRPSDGAKFVAFSRWGDHGTNPGGRTALHSDRTPVDIFGGPQWSASLGWCDDFDDYGNYIDQFAVSDIDGDGSVDLVCHNGAASGTGSGNTYTLHGNRGTRASQFTTGAPVASGWCTAVGAGALPTLQLVDFDGDGRKDFLCREHVPFNNLIAFYPMAGMR